MTHTYTITLTADEQKWLDLVTSDAQGWIENAVQARCLYALEIHTKKVIGHCLQNDIAIPGSKSEIINYGLENGIIATSAELEARNTVAPQAPE